MCQQRLVGHVATAYLLSENPVSILKETIDTQLLPARLEFARTR